MEDLFYKLYQHELSQTTYAFNVLIEEYVAEISVFQYQTRGFISGIAVELSIERQYIEMCLH